METMKPSKLGPTPPATATATATKIREEDGIPVRELVFCVARPAGPDLPLPGFNGGVARLRAGDAVKIDYIPRLRAHRIIAKRTGRGDGELTVIVPEAWCSWEPL